MARGRMISVSVAIDRRLNALSLEAQLVFLMTIPHLDRDGLIAGDPPLLAGKVLPRRTELHAHVADLIQEWLDAKDENGVGLVISYATADTQVLFFPGFAKNQTFQYAREGASQFPPPPGYLRTASGLVLDENKPAPEQLQSDSRVIPDKITVKLNEVKVKTKQNQKEDVEKMPCASKKRAVKSQDPAQTARHLEIMTTYRAVVGYPLANEPAENKAAQKLAHMGYTASEVKSCYELLRADEFWGKGHIGLQTVATQIGARCGPPAAQAPLVYAMRPVSLDAAEALR